MKDSTKNSAPIAPANAGPSASSSAKPRVAAPEKGTLVKKTGNAKGGTDPYAQAKPSRSNVRGTSGARYGIRVMFQKSTAPEAGATQANGRIIPGRSARQSSGFSEGTSDFN